MDVGSSASQRIEHLRAQPVSRYAGGRSEGYDAELLVLLRWEQFHRGVS